MTAGYELLSRAQYNYAINCQLTRQKQGKTINIITIDSLFCG